MPSSRWFYLAPLVAPLFMTPPAAAASLAHDCEAAPSSAARVEACSALIEAGKETASSYRHRGLSHAENGDYDKALADYDRALQLDPKDAVALTNRGNIYRDDEEYERALADYDAALQFAPDDGDVHYSRALVLIELREYDRAIADFDRAVALKPDFATAYIDRGITHVSRGSYDRALADFDQMLAIDPKNAEGYYVKGLALAWLNRIDDARRNIEQAVDLLPEEARVDWIDSACWELGTLGRAGLALPYCDQAKAAEHDAELLDSRAFALWQLGDEAGARQELQTAQRKSPGDGAFEPTRRLKEFRLVLVQGLLTGLGYDPRYIDGEPAPETTEAIRSFQKTNGMTVDGKISEALIAALKAAQPS